jgi:hypothetical protein
MTVTISNSNVPGRELNKLVFELAETGTLS